MLGCLFWMYFAFHNEWTISCHLTKSLYSPTSHFQQPIWIDKTHRILFYDLKSSVYFWMRAFVRIFWEKHSIYTYIKPYTLGYYIERLIEWTCNEYSYPISFSFDVDRYVRLCIYLVAMFHYECRCKYPSRFLLLNK